MNNSEDIEKLTAGDLTHKTIKVALSAIPVVGSAIAELFTTIIEEPVQRRRVEWLNTLYVKLTEIEVKVDWLSLEKLGENEKFVSVLLTASQIAQRNHQKEKLEALRNAVLNTAVMIDIHDDLKFLFLSFVDELTVTELRILAVANDPIGWAKSSGHEVDPKNQKIEILNLIFPDREENRSTYKLFAKNLHFKGLLKVEFFDNLSLNFGNSGDPHKIISNLGESFLRFISEPIGRV